MGPRKLQAEGVVIRVQGSEHAELTTGSCRDAIGAKVSLTQLTRTRTYIYIYTHIESKICLSLSLT